MITFNVDGGVFNYRACVFITNRKEDLVLLQDIGDYLVLPGGRVEILESAEDASKRELKEELGLEVESLTFKIINKNFFKANNKSYHEIGFYYKYVLDTGSNLFLNKDSFEGLEGKNYIFKWYNINSLDNFRIEPLFFKDTIKDKFNYDSIKHIITNDLGK